MGQNASSKFPSNQDDPFLNPDKETTSSPVELDPTPKPKSVSMLDYSGPYFSSIFVQNSDSLVLGGTDGNLFYYSQNPPNVCRLNGHTNDITSLAFDSSLSLVASGSRDEYICLWDVSKIAEDKTKHRSYPINNLHGHELTVTALAIDQSQLFSGSRDNTVCLWDLNTGSCLNRCSIPRNLVTCVKWIPGERCVLQSSEDKHLRVWDTRTMDVVQNLLHPQCLLTACDVSQDGRSFYTSSRGPVENSATATRWDRYTGAVLREYPHLSDNLNTCHLCNELNCLITASNGGSLYFWDVEKGVLLFEKKYYSGPIYSIHRMPGHSDVLCSTHNRGIQIFSFNKSTLGPLQPTSFLIKASIQ
ncbi:WD repeat-containing protein 31 isoform X1 [Oopsacas minuta]|uniref:WD repeat-containing protein 31 isoform X1 n=1 Tax=Oopsacas minuta TaxID=111878 RepID=A0AAV7JRY2_9METZ|nr:WD repeat-containing protein 31 isoform X1 [Oopsacas minuta]